MTPIKRLLRRVPLLRRFAYHYARQVRADRREAKWAYAQSVLATVGNITIMWAGIERVLDQLIAWYQQNCTDLSKKHPRQFSEKLKYLRRFEDDDRLTDETIRFIRYVREEGARLSDVRNDIIHGLLWHQGGHSLSWQTQRVVYDGPNAYISRSKYHNDDLQNLSKEICNFLNHIAPTIWILCGGNPDEYSRDQIRSAFNELGLLTP